MTIHRRWNIGRTACLLALVMALSWCLSANAVDKIRVACVGNSITYGYGISDPASDSYPSQLQRLLGDEYEVGNFGRNGATLLYRGHRPYVEQPEFHEALAFKADIVVIHLGLNDTDPRNWPNYGDDFVEDYCALIDSFRNANPRARIIIARMSPISNRHARFLSGTRDWFDKIQALIPVVAARADVEMTDFYTPLYYRLELFADGLHPNVEGAGILSNVVFRHITGDYGGLRLPEVYGNGMVLQRDRPLSIHGIADAGQKVKVRIAGKTATATAGEDGQWEVILPPLFAGGPWQLSVSTRQQTITFDDVMIGEVWLCSGQSNMAFRLADSAEYAETMASGDTLALFGDGTSRSLLRICNRRARYETSNIEWDSLALVHVNQLDYLSSSAWTLCNATTARDLSAVAFFFGRMLADSLKVPVGLIVNAVGGTPAESWIDRYTLEHAFPAILTDWLNNDFIQGWCRERASKNIALTLDRSSSFPFSNTGECLQRHPYQPCYMFESGIRPLEHFPLRGVIWYQGESNAHNMEVHEQLFPLLVDSWRDYFHDADMPFLFVQLSSLNRPSWPAFRDSQRRLSLQIPGVAMAVSSDVGDSLDVHPKHKQQVGERLARLALSDTYRLPFFQTHPAAAQGPRPTDVTFSKGKAVVQFDCAEQLSTSDGAPLRTFELADEFGVFHPAEATIDGSIVVVKATSLKRQPTAVRYGWQPFTRANLVNEFGLPASTFCITQSDNL